MSEYREITFLSSSPDGMRCIATKVRARLLGTVIELGDSEKHTPDKVTSFYEAESGGNIVYNAVYYREGGVMISFWRRVASLDELRCDTAYQPYLERLNL